MTLQDFRDGTVFRRRTKRNSRRTTAWVCWWLAIAYGWWETAYFGWNTFPKSGSEMACDGIALLLIIITSYRIADTSTASNRG